MTIFVDASALVAMILPEHDGENLAAVARSDGEALWSAMSCWEAVLAISKRRGMTLAAARGEIEALAAAMPFTLVPIGEDERALAMDAHEVFGKGRHRARLNMGDCFAYACAKTNNARLLYKGQDFIHTDLA